MPHIRITPRQRRESDEVAADVTDERSIGQEHGAESELEAEARTWSRATSRPPESWRNPAPGVVPMPRSQRRGTLRKSSSPTRPERLHTLLDRLERVPVTATLDSFRNRADASRTAQSRPTARRSRGPLASEPLDFAANRHGQPLLVSNAVVSIVYREAA